MISYFYIYTCFRVWKEDSKVIRTLNYAHIIEHDNINKPTNLFYLLMLTHTLSGAGTKTRFNVL